MRSLFGAHESSGSAGNVRFNPDSSRWRAARRSSTLRTISARANAPESTADICSNSGKICHVADIGAIDEDPALEDLSDFLRAHVHPHYRLADLLHKGVAFHYGNIPQIIRGRVEELLRERVLRFVCCTSTLLQGMNLPAKNIFVENPKKGRGRPMSTGDFWNLVGRAGRMAKEFNGNVYCVHGQQWETNPLQGSKLDAIKSAFALALTEKVTSLAEVVASPPNSAESDLSWAEQAVARIYSNFVRNGELTANSQFSTSSNRSTLLSIDEFSARFRKRQTLPDQIYADNIYMHPARIEDLAIQFRSSIDATRWIPPNPNAPGSYDRLVPVFQLLETIFFRTGFKTYKYDAFLALRWMQGLSLKELIENKISWNKAGGDVERINDLIRELFDEVGNRLRFKYVKYMKIYADVLSAVLVEQNRASDLASVPPIHLFLEYGAASLTLINFIALGLSRTSAILLRSMRGLGENLSIAQCQQLIDTISVDSANLPAICASEIRRLRHNG